MDEVQLVMVGARGRQGTLRLALEDAAGDSASIGFDHGQMAVHQGRQYTLMTNDPSYNKRRELLSRQYFSHSSRDMPLRGNVNPVDRFQRAANYLALLPESDLTDRLYFFQLITSPNAIWVELDGLYLSEGGQPSAVDAYDESPIGNVTARFTARQPAF